MFMTRYTEPEAVGYLIPQYVRCGKPGCHCRQGHSHGPYWYLRFRRLEHGVWTQRKRYVPVHMVPAMRMRLEANKARDRSMMNLARRSRRLRGAVRSRIAGRISDHELERICHDLQE